MIHHSAPKLTTKAAPHSITSPPDTETGSKPQLNIKTATIKPTKSISKSVTEWLKFIAMAFLYGLGILMFYAYILPGPVFPNGGSTNPKFVSAAPSCEVFNSAISIVETTCSWEPPKPSALILAASSTLTGPNPNPAESELFWTDTAQLCGNCSTADGSSHERDADRDACDDMRQHSERKTAIRIAVTVVVPCVVFGAFHWSVGYF